LLRGPKVKTQRVSPLIFRQVFPHFLVYIFEYFMSDNWH